MDGASWFAFSGSHSHSRSVPIGILLRGDSPFIGEKERTKEGEGGREGRRDICVIIALPTQRHALSPCSIPRLEAISDHGLQGDLTGCRTGIRGKLNNS